MSALKRILLVLTAAVMALPLFCCGNKETDNSTSEVSVAEDTAKAEEETSEEASDEPVQAPIPLEYDGTEVADPCAQVISDYFTAIMNQDYEAYKATLDPYYFEVYNSWLDGTYGYGMETSFETMHQNLMDAAVSANDGNDIVSMTVSKLKLSETVPAEDEEPTAYIDDYLAQYDSVIGEGFTEELRGQCDDVINITFTMIADCDGNELEIMTEMELLMTVHGDEYKILG